MDTLGRKTRTENESQGFFFDFEPDWKSHWWGMPSFEMADARPQYKIAVNFMTPEDVADFAKKTGLRVTTDSDTCWWPDQKPLNGEYFYDGPQTDSVYPICIPSKGRAKIQRTGTALRRLGVSHRFFVEETEYDEYCKYVGFQNVVKLPFHDLGQGSIPARNFIWDWAKERGYKRHWTVDDNIANFTRMDNNRRLVVKGGGFFRAMEEFVDRYENIAIAGPHDQGFVKDRGDVRWPYILNTRVYSCILLDTALPHRWRGRYNEDTDLSLRVLKDGYCTLLFHSLLMNKMPTVGVRNCSPMKGGNTDNVYAGDDNRRKFAESLQEQHPEIVKVVWKFNRWHHQVDYSAFKKNRLRLREGIVPSQATNDFRMTLRRNDKKESL